VLGVVSGDLLGVVSGLCVGVAVASLDGSVSTDLVGSGDGVVSVEGVVPGSTETEALGDGSACAAVADSSVTGAMTAVAAARARERRSFMGPQKVWRAGTGGRGHEM
jgi:hypothetical protein